MPDSHIAVFTCGDLGMRVARDLMTLPTVGRVTVWRAPWKARRRRGWDRIRYFIRMNGWRALFGALVRRLRADRSEAAVPAKTAVPVGVKLVHVPDFEDADVLRRIEQDRPELGVVAGTYILRPALFEIPRRGSINLHTGKVPEYRGAAPAFWELYHGEREVGVTVHQVTEGLDAGAVYAQDTVPLDPVPEADPLDYVERFREQVLLPAGVRLLVATVDAILRGDATGRPQDPGRARTFRTPTHRQVKELRRRVRRRRDGDA